MDPSKINTYDRVDADLNDWEAALQDIRNLVSKAEISGDTYDFREARVKIATMLEEMKQTRGFIEYKRQIAASITAGVEKLFSADGAEYEVLEVNIPDQE